MTKRIVCLALTLLALSACASDKNGAGITSSAGTLNNPSAAPAGMEIIREVVASFDEPWAMAELPDGSLLVTEKGGRLFRVWPDGRKSTPINGVPEVAYGGQGGLGDVILHPTFTYNGIIFISYAEAGDGNTRGAAVARARLSVNDEGGELNDLEVIWRQHPKVSGRGHYGHRLAFDKDGFLFISSGDRQKFTPAQDMQSTMGKIIRLREDGSVPEDNPFYDQGGVTAEIWSLGQRNPLGIAFDAEGRLWEHEMGPAGGDELNLIVKGENYGYPVVSNGDHYDGRPIPDHDTRPGFAAPLITWTPVIAPAGFIIYSGDEFPEWQGSGPIGGLKSEGIVPVAFDGDTAREVERIDMGERIREIGRAADGTLWVLEDGDNARLLRLSVAK